MGKNKDSLIYPALSSVAQRKRCYQMLIPFCERVFLSCRADREADLSREFPVIVDAFENEGPGVGILSANSVFPEVSWLVLACDFPFADEKSVGTLVEQRSINQAATFFTHTDSTIEPLFTIWEKPALDELRAGFASFDFSPRRALERVDQNHSCQRVTSPEHRFLTNINSPQDIKAHGLISDLLK
jgi:molybdopterin-guanine dinucleotide biosynthesis protein A